MNITFITEANKGLGYETARRLIELGQTVVIGARDRERGEAAAAELGARFVTIDVAKRFGLTTRSDRSGYSIETDDQSGIEACLHTRFWTKRIRDNDFFTLD